MVDPQAVQHRGVQVMRGHGVFADVVREIVGLAVSDAGLDASAGQPHAETARMVIAAVLRLGELSLAEDRAAEFAPPDDERLIEKTTLAKIAQQTGLRLIDVLALERQIVGNAAMVVPARDGKAG